MGTFLVLVMLAAMIAFGVYRRKNYKQGISDGQKFKRYGWKTAGMQFLIFMVFVFIINIVAPDTSDDEATTDSEPRTQQSAKTKRKAAPKREKQSSSSSTQSSKPKKAKKPTVTKANKQAAALLMLKENFKGTAKVWFDAENKSFMIQPTGDEFKSELLGIIASQDTTEWDTLTKSMDKLSRSLYKNLGLADFISIVNPDNPDKVLYSSLDGKTAYDFLSDTDN